MIGHSLGAQVAGFAGKELQKLIGKYFQIIGLDPAGPFFGLNSCSQRICETDAYYVQIIHTSVPLGTERTLGTIDFYMNNGIFQPGCNVGMYILHYSLSKLKSFTNNYLIIFTLVDASCSHTKAVLYFTECIKRECCLIGIPWKEYVVFINILNFFMLILLQNEPKMITMR